MLHISPVLVSLFSAIYSQGKVCRSILEANSSLSSYINKTSRTVWNAGLVLMDDLEEPQIHEIKLWGMNSQLHRLQNRNHN